jgi:hypothetical protein
MKKLALSPVGIRRLKSKAEKAWKVYKALKEELDQRCTHPEEFLVTEGIWSTDTLGNNGDTSYYDKCEICGKSQGQSYGGVYGGGYTGGPHHRMAKER